MKPIPDPSSITLVLPPSSTASNDEMHISSGRQYGCANNRLDKSSPPSQAASPNLPPKPCLRRKVNLFRYGEDEWRCDRGPKFDLLKSTTVQTEKHGRENKNVRYPNSSNAPKRPIPILLTANSQNMSSNSPHCFSAKVYAFWKNWKRYSETGGKAVANGCRRAAAKACCPSNVDNNFTVVLRCENMRSKGRICK